MIKSIWDLFNSKYNDASRYTEEETKLAEEVLSDVQTLLELDADKNDYCWHDIRKNPDDLPEEEGEYIIFYLFNGVDGVGKRYTIEKFEPLIGWYCPNFVDVLAWREIEPFEEEE